MKTWQEDLLTITEQGDCERAIFASIEVAARALGFDFCAYGYRSPLPVSNPRIALLNNYPVDWSERYSRAGYLEVDPTVQHGRRSQAPMVWSDAVFGDSPALWEEARAAGLRVGWAQSSLDGLGIGGMLTLCRSAEPLSSAELSANEQKMRWLVHVAHLALARVFRAKQPGKLMQGLTSRELEILKWTADGKSSQDIADILTVSKNTVDFHVRNAVSKLQAANKTAAVVRAAILGYLN
ncbi:autoinducer binding domain-containing protein [Ideonella sp. DXS29W]|uniref:Autoinducer binding domain-containing protein n=1 Tax=Ideonella lacteola TaxID=2984193 RepID=A0ABU9BXZ9_9BURK